MPTIYTDVLAALIVATLGFAALLPQNRERIAQRIASVGWVLFGSLWAILTPYYLFELHSFVEGALAIIGIPVCLHVSRCLWTGRSTTLKLSNAIAGMGALYLLMYTLPSIAGFPSPKQVLIEIVAVHTAELLHVSGFDPLLRTGPNGYMSEIALTASSGAVYTTYIKLACTGIGSITIFGGLLGASDTTWKRRLVVFIALSGIIYVLNLFRNAFIMVAYAHQWLQIFPEQMMGFFGYEYPASVSFFMAHNAVSQPLSVIALVGLTLGLVRVAPNVVPIIDEALYALTATDLSISGLTSRKGE